MEYLQIILKILLLLVLQRNLVRKLGWTTERGACFVAWYIYAGRSVTREVKILIMTLFYQKFWLRRLKKKKKKNIPAYFETSVHGIPRNLSNAVVLIFITVIFFFFFFKLVSDNSPEHCPPMSTKNEQIRPRIDDTLMKCLTYWRDQTVPIESY